MQKNRKQIRQIIWKIIQAKHKLSLAMMPDKIKNVAKSSFQFATNILLSMI